MEMHELWASPFTLLHSSGFSNLTPSGFSEANSAECRQSEDWIVPGTSHVQHREACFCCGLGKVTESLCFGPQSLNWELCVPSLIYICQSSLENCVEAI